MVKRSLRRTVCSLRDSLTPGEIRQKSSRIARKLYLLPAYRQAQTVMFFLSFRSEVDTREMVDESMARGKRVLVPRSVPATRQLTPSVLLDPGRDLAPGAYGIPEPRLASLRPAPPGEIDLLIVPGVAFDPQGHRLGYGGGYYDRFFPLLRPGVPLVALAFELQVLDEVPVEEWDRPVDWIVTEARVIFTGWRAPA
jgi:5-formyltetrahydrofolate cyclo-ligase